MVRGYTRVSVCVADTAVGQFQALEHMILATGPDGSAIVLVAGKVFDHRFQPRAVGVAGIRIGQMRVPAQVEFTLRIGAAIEHQPVNVGVSDVAGKLLQLHTTRPGSLTDFRAFKLTRWMFRESHPETCCLRTCGHITAVSIVGVRDPEGGRRVVGRNQLVGGIPGRPLSRSGRLSNHTVWWDCTGSSIPGCEGTGCRVPRHLRGSSSDRRCCTPHCSQPAHCLSHVRSRSGCRCRESQSSTRCIAPAGIANQMPMDRIPRKVLVLSPFERTRRRRPAFSTRSSPSHARH